jgi:CDP-diacylglycerol--glycerol-3-phosphate 3-phosphatidyltransferase
VQETQHEMQNSDGNDNSGHHGAPVGAGRSQFGRAVHRFNLPNVLTTVRIILIPVFVWLLLAAGPLDGGPGPRQRAALVGPAVVLRAHGD